MEIKNFLEELDKKLANKYGSKIVLLNKTEVQTNVEAFSKLWEEKWFFGIVTKIEILRIIFEELNLFSWIWFVNNFFGDEKFLRKIQEIEEFETSVFKLNLPYLTWNWVNIELRTSYTVWWKHIICSEFSTLLSFDENNWEEEYCIWWIIYSNPSFIKTLEILQEVFEKHKEIEKLLEN